MPETAVWAEFALVFGVTGLGWFLSSRTADRITGIPQCPSMTGWVTAFGIWVAIGTGMNCVLLWYAIPKERLEVDAAQAMLLLAPLFGVAWASAWVKIARARRRRALRGRRA